MVAPNFDLLSCAEFNSRHFAGLMNDFEGLYLDSDLYFICNNIESPIVNLILSSIKADARYTTNQQIFKLNGTYYL